MTVRARFHALLATAALSLALPTLASAQSDTGRDYAPPSQGQNAQIMPQTGSPSQEPAVQPPDQPVENPSQPNKKSNYRKLAPIPEVGTGAAAYGKPSERLSGPQRNMAVGSGAGAGADAALGAGAGAAPGAGAANAAGADSAARGPAEGASQNWTGAARIDPAARPDQAGAAAQPSGIAARRAALIQKREEAARLQQEKEQVEAEQARQDKEKAAEEKERAEKAAAQADTLLKMRSYEEAVRSATQALTANPYDVDMLVVRSQAFSRLGRYQEAKADAERAAELDAKRAKGWNCRAWAEQRLGSFRDAMAHASQAILLEPMNALPYAIRAYAKESLGDRDGALEDMKVAAQLDARYQERLEAVRKGGKLYDPSLDDGYLLMDLVAAPRSTSSATPLLALGGALFLLLAGGFVWLLLRRSGKAQTGGTWQKDLASAMAPPGAAAPVGGAAPARLQGKYELVRLIGRGGMGEVYEGQDHTLGRAVAVKKLSETYASLDPQAKERMLREAKAVAALRHPAIVQIYEVFEAGGALYLVFEFVQGKTLQQLLAERKTLPLDQALGVLGPVCQALSHAHAQNLVHRDVKPANIMVTQRGEVKLMDFGIARALGTAAEGPQPAAAAQYGRTATVSGTPLYSAPETESGVVSRQADVYSLGVCLYEMVTGRTPYPAPAERAQKERMDYLPPSLRSPELPARVDEAVAGALQADPEKRTKTPEEFLRKLAS